MVDFVLVPGHIKGYMVLLSKDLALQVMSNEGLFDSLTESQSYFFLWKDGTWLHNPPEIEVRFQQSYGRDEWHVFYGRMRSRDEYNRAHLMVAGHSPAVGGVKRYGTQTLSDLLNNLVLAVKNLNDYQDRERAEERSMNLLLRAWKWLGTSPNEDRMRLPWSIVIVVVPNLDEWKVDSDRATIPGFFRVV
jgi:hypothetical protein